MRKGKNWLARLSRSARWRLGAEEAGEVIADYRELLDGDQRTEEELVRDLGTPKDVVMQLTTEKAYHLWLVWFTVMAVCLLAAAMAPTPLSPTFHLLRWYEWGGNWHESGASWFHVLPFLPQLELLAGIVLCSVWTLRRRGEAKRPLSKGFWLCVLLALAGIALSWWGIWRITSTPETFMTIWTEIEVISEGVEAAYSGKSSLSIRHLTAWLEWGGCLFMGVVGMVGLVKARMENRRWAVVYVLALTAVILSLAVIAMLGNFHHLNPLRETFSADWFTPYFRRFAGLTVLGLIGTGVALC